MFKRLQPGAPGYGQIDMGNVDQLAVDFACNGTAMKLNRDERRYVVARIGGRYPSDEIARRCCTYEREVLRDMEKFGAVSCPVCKRFAYLTVEGVFSRHVDSLGVKTCPMTGHVINDPDQIRRNRSIFDLARTA